MTEPGRTVSIWLSADMERKLARIQEVEGISRSSAIRMAIEHIYECPKL